MDNTACVGRFLLEDDYFLKSVKLLNSVEEKAVSISRLVEMALLEIFLFSTNSITVEYQTG